MYGVVPPVVVVEMLPLLPPKQRTLDTEGVNDKAVGSAIVAEIVDTQLFASVTVTVNVPIPKPEMSSVVALFDHEKV